MAVTKFNISELERFALQRLRRERLVELIERLGFPVEGFEEGCVLVDITPNRIDAASPEGLGRALASLTGKKTGLRRYATKPSGLSLTIHPSVLSVRPHIVAAVARLPLGEDGLRALIGLQEKIHDTFGRRRRKASIGIHDLDRTKPPFTYRALAGDAIAFQPLDSAREMTPTQILTEHPKGREYRHIVEGKRLLPLVLDAHGPISFPPIINAERTRVTEKSKNLFIEVTGTSAEAVSQALNIICCALAERGASIESVRCGKKLTPQLKPAERTLSLELVNSVLGTNLTAARAASLLARMGFGASARGASITVLVPPYRTDILHEIDFVEDIAIALGYDSPLLTPTLPELPTIGSIIDRPPENTARRTLIGLGFVETMGNTLTCHRTNFDLLLLPHAPACEVLNPLTEEHSLLRTHLLPSLLLVFQNAKSEKTPQRIFEIGPAFDAQGREHTRLAAAELDAAASYASARSIADALFAELGWQVVFAPAHHPTFIPGRVAKILLGKRELGFIGELHPQVLNNFGLEQPVAAFEIALA
ncbi:MAG: phenylalanine--tRNA ligase subunit beta [Candidatus Micrarchaeia archaeon]